MQAHASSDTLDFVDAQDGIYIYENKEGSRKEYICVDKIT